MFYRYLSHLNGGHTARKIVDGTFLCQKGLMMSLCGWGRGWMLETVIFNFLCHFYAQPPPNYYSFSPIPTLRVHPHSCAICARSTALFVFFNLFMLIDSTFLCPRITTFKRYREKNHGEKFCYNC